MVIINIGAEGATAMLPAAGCCCLAATELLLRLLRLLLTASKEGKRKASSHSCSQRKRMIRYPESISNLHIIVIRDMTCHMIYLSICENILALYSKDIHKNVASDDY